MSEELSPLDRAEQLNAKMEENIRKQEELLKKQEDLAARQLLSGRAIAGQQQEKKEETPTEYVKKVMSGKV